MPPPLLKLPDVRSYRDHFENIYCRGPITTFDGIQVRFRRDDFNHCCFESSRRDGYKDQFSTVRAQRLDWILAALEDPASERYQGWDGKRKRIDPRRRVTLVYGNYVVVISITKQNTAKFITAYWADESNTLTKIRANPVWA